MNREQRRKSGKVNTKQGDIKNLPCTIAEVVQISKGVTEDSLKDYHNTLSPMLISISLQLELLKSILFDNDIITEDKYNELFADKLEEFNQDRKDILDEISKSKDNQEEPEADVSFDTKPEGPTVVEFKKKED